MRRSPPRELGRGRCHAGGRSIVGDRDDGRHARVPRRGLYDAADDPGDGRIRQPGDRAERIERLKWALDRTLALGLSDLTLHAGFLPEAGDPERKAMLDTLARAGQLAAEKGVTLAFETGQETAELLRQTLDELKSPNLKVNFDPANMILYDMGDPIRAVEILGPDIRSVHLKDARRTRVRGQWGEEVPLGEGEVNLPSFLRALKSVGFAGSLAIEREVGDQAGRLKDVATGLARVREWLKSVISRERLVIRGRPDFFVSGSRAGRNQRMTRSLMAEVQRIPSASPRS